MATLAQQAQCLFSMCPDQIDSNFITFFCLCLLLRAFRIATILIATLVLLVVIFSDLGLLFLLLCRLSTSLLVWRPQSSTIGYTSTCGFLVAFRESAISVVAYGISFLSSSLTQNIRSFLFQPGVLRDGIVIRSEPSVLDASQEVCDIFLESHSV